MNENLCLAGNKMIELKIFHVKKKKNEERKKSGIIYFFKKITFFNMRSEFQHNFTDLKVQKDSDGNPHN